MLRSIDKLMGGFFGDANPVGQRFATNIAGLFEPIASNAGHEAYIPLAKRDVIKVGIG